MVVYHGGVHTLGTPSIGIDLFDTSMPMTPSMTSTWKPVSEAAIDTASSLSVRSFMLMTNTFPNYES